MQVEVLLTHHHGVPLPEREMLAAAPMRGGLQTVMRDSKSGHVLVAELRSDRSTIAKPLARLSRAELALISATGLRLRGLERVGGAWVAQGWLCQLIH